MFKFLSLREQLMEEKRKNDALNAQAQELMDAVIELAGIVATNEEVLNG
jgi:hypothetical protein